MREHIKILGILNIVLGGLSALGGLIVLIVLGGVAGAIGIAAPAEHSGDAAVAVPIVALAGLVIGAFLILLGLPAIIGGWGLINYRPWARVLVIVLSVFHLLHVPLGTAVGVYGLWVLLGDEGQAAFSAESSALAQRYPGAFRP